MSVLGKTKINNPSSVNPTKRNNRRKPLIFGRFATTMRFSPFRWLPLLVVPFLIACGDGSDSSTTGTPHDRGSPTELDNGSRPGGTTDTTPPPIETGEGEVVSCEQDLVVCSTDFLESLNPDKITPDEDIPDQRIMVEVGKIFSTDPEEADSRLVLPNCYSVASQGIIEDSDGSVDRYLFAFFDPEGNLLDEGHISPDDYHLGKPLRTFLSGDGNMVRVRKCSSSSCFEVYTLCDISSIVP